MGRSRSPSRSASGGCGSAGGAHRPSSCRARNGCTSHSIRRTTSHQRLTRTSGWTSGDKPSMSGPVSPATRSSAAYA
eukprot:6028492-Lingulodinium_polyedra.AAC.1